MSCWLLGIRRCGQPGNLGPDSIDHLFRCKYRKDAIFDGAEERRRFVVRPHKFEHPAIDTQPCSPRLGLLPRALSSQLLAVEKLVDRYAGPRQGPGKCGFDMPK